MSRPRFHYLVIVLGSVILYVLADIAFKIYIMAGGQVAVPP